MKKIIKLFSKFTILSIIFCNFNINTEDVEFLAISDMHVCVKKDGSINKAHYPAMQTKSNVIPDMTKFIENHKINAVLIPGDLTGGGYSDTFGRENKNAFLTTWTIPLERSLNKINGKLLCTIGNHDFDCRHWPHYPEIVQWVNKKYENLDPFRSLGYSGNRYRYAININGLLFISLGYGPRGGSIGRSDSGYLGGQLPASGTNEWLKKYLKEQLKENKTQPIILFFHTPVAGSQGKFMKKKDMEEFWGIIKDYNVKVMIVGHTHNGMKSLLWKNKFWQIDVSGHTFVYITYDKKTDTLKAFNVFKYDAKNKIIVPINRPNVNTETPDSEYDMAPDYKDF